MFSERGEATAGGEGHVPAAVALATHAIDGSDGWDDAVRTRNSGTDVSFTDLSRLGTCYDLFIPLIHFQRSLHSLTNLHYRHTRYCMIQNRFIKRIIFQQNKQVLLFQN